MKQQTRDEDEMPSGYHVTSISGHGVEGTKYYFSRNGSWTSEQIGKLPEATLYDTREEAVKAAWAAAAAS